MWLILSWENFNQTSSSHFISQFPGVPGIPQSSNSGGRSRRYFSVSILPFIHLMRLGASLPHPLHWACAAAHRQSAGLPDSIRVCTKGGSHEKEGRASLSLFGLGYVFLAKDCQGGESTREALCHFRRKQNRAISLPFPGSMARSRAPYILSFNPHYNSVRQIVLFQIRNRVTHRKIKNWYEIA